MRGSRGRGYNTEEHQGLYGVGLWDHVYICKINVVSNILIYVMRWMGMCILLGRLHGNHECRNS